jgi:hypothetical protein
LHDVDEDRVHLSVASLAELRYGVERLSPGARRRQLTSWLEAELPDRFAGRIVPIDGLVAEAWGRMMAKREQAGRPFGAMDAFFAATASVHGLTLATRNGRDFSGLGISIFDPWQAAARP